MDFIDYTIDIYRARLIRFEEMTPVSMDRESVQRAAMDASAMKKFMFDNLDEGYESTFNRFVNELDVVRRLLTDGSGDSECIRPFPG